MVDTTLEGEYVSPYRLAKDLGERPQVFFHLAKKDKVRWERSDQGTIHVRKQDILDWLKNRDTGQAIRRDTKVKNLAPAHSPPFARGVIFTYHPRYPGTKPVIAQVEKAEAFITTMKVSKFSRKQTRLPEQVWRNETLHKLIEEKVIAILDPWDVLVMIAKQFAFCGQQERGRRLMEFIKREREIRKEEKQVQEEVQV